MNKGTEDLFAFFIRGFGCALTQNSHEDLAIKISRCTFEEEKRERGVLSHFSTQMCFLESTLNWASPWKVHDDSYSKEVFLVVDDEPKHFLYVTTIRRRGLVFTYMCTNLFELTLKTGRVLFGLWGHSNWMRTDNTHCLFDEHSWVL